MKKLRISATVGQGGRNRAEDVDVVARQLQAIGKLEGDGKSMMSQAPIRGLGDYTHIKAPMAFAQPRMCVMGEPSGPQFDFGQARTEWNLDSLIISIKAFQRIFTSNPDGLITPNGLTFRFLRDWSVKPVQKDVNLQGRLQEAWDLVNPLLPKGSICKSGLRTKEDQRALLQRFFLDDYRQKIIAKYGQASFDAAKSDMLKNEKTLHSMVNGVGQKISMPGNSKHQFGKAIDVGGPKDEEQVKVIGMVAKANPTLFSGSILLEANGCVHFELR
jgi:hypothetical protein